MTTLTTGDCEFLSGMLEDALTSNLFESNCAKTFTGWFVEELIDWCDETELEDVLWFALYAPIFCEENPDLEIG